MAETELAATMTFGEMLDALALVFRIHPDAKETFKSRVQQIQKRIPGMAGTGRGQKRAYNSEDALHMAVILDMLGAGLTPQSIERWLKYSVFGDKRQQISIEVAAAVRAGEPLVLAVQALGDIQRGLSAPVYSVGIPENPAQFGPFVAVYPAARASQLAAAIKMRASCNDPA